MLENIYTTKMSAEKKQLQSRFTKIRSHSSKLSKIAASVTAVVIAVTFVCATVVMAAFNNGEDTEPITLYANGEAPGAFISSGFVWPCEGEISNSFGERENPATGKVIRHNGIDIAAAEGTEVNAAMSGTVTETGYDAERGYFLIIEKDNIQIVYANLTQDIQVKEGDELFKGQSIGEVGNTGTSTGAHLHFEVLINGEYYNPELIS